MAAALPVQRAPLAAFGALALGAVALVICAGRSGSVVATTDDHTLGRAARSAPPAPVQSPSAQTAVGVESAAAPDPEVVPVLSPDQSIANFKMAPGFRAQCAAAEPMVEDPVAIAFDEDGRAWVVEMRAYMPDAEGHGEEAPDGRIVVLDDRDGDGDFDTRTVFMDGLVMPRAVLPCYGGALVLEPPRLYFCRDTSGDGKADTKREVLTGLGGQNPEHAPNALTYGLDNWVHMSQAGVEFRFDGDKLVTRPTPGHGQWGMTMDESGRLYYTPNSEALRADLYPKHYASRNTDQRGADGINTLVCRDQTVWPACPTPGVNRGYQPGVLRADGTLASHTAACGPAIDDASFLGDGRRGSVFVCEPAAFMVRRLTMRETDRGPEARNAYDHAEFLTSTDERFRPVNAAIGPDGALYVVDMHRGVIQHKTYLTPYLKDQAHARGLEKPLHRGRIYRVTPEAGTPTPRERLGSADTARLVDLLAHPDGWWRRAAQRLLVERRSSEAEGALRAMAASGATFQSRLHAIWTLEGVRRVTDEDLERASNDPHAAVRSAALRIGEGRGAQSRRVIDRLISDADRGVRVQAVLSLGSRTEPESLEALRRAFENNREDAIVRGAIIGGVGGRTLEFLRLIMQGDWRATSGGRAMVSDLCDCVLRSRSAEERAAMVDLVGALGAERPDDAEFVLARLRRAQQLDSETARIVEVGREPRGWLALAAAPGRLGEGVKESDYYLTWPGKPHVDPPRRIRPLTAREVARFDAGGAIFGGGCAACHGHDGAGIPGQIPPLAGSARAQGNEARAIRILVNGLEGSIDNAAGAFNGSMPPAPISADDDLAAVLTYIRRAWGNAGDPVTPERVRQVREEIKGRNRPWTAAELEQIK